MRRHYLFYGFALVCLIACVSFASCILLFIKEQSTRRKIRGAEERKRKKERRRNLMHMCGQGILPFRVQALLSLIFMVFEKNGNEYQI